MTASTAAAADWTIVDEGWGRRAARERVRDGLPLRAELAVTGSLARKAAA